MSKFKLALIVIAGLVVAGVASAALVTILSNTAEVTADVAAPVDVTINDEYELDIDAVGNDTVTLNVATENLSNNAINGISTMAIEGDSLTGEEITAITLNGVDVTNTTCVVDETGSLRTLSSLTADYSKITLLLYGSNPPGCAGTALINDIAAGPDEIETDIVNITLHQAVEPGTYTVSANYVDNLSESASETE